jgi:hypothetical protein
MQNKPSSKRRRKISTANIKWLILVFSVSVTLFFWSLFARQAYTDTIAAAPADTEAPPAPAPEIVLDLPPLPTLVPDLPKTTTGISQQAPQQGASQIAAPVNQAPVKIYLGGAKPQARISAPAPVTRTHSSR